MTRLSPVSAVFLIGDFSLIRMRIIMKAIDSEFVKMKALEYGLRLEDAISIWHESEDEEDFIGSIAHMATGEINPA